MSAISKFLVNKVWGKIKRISQWITIQPCYRLYNIYLKIRFILFHNHLKKVDFLSNKKLIFKDEFKTLDNFNIKDGEFYNNNNTWLSKDTLSLIPEGLSIKCIKDKSTHTSWQGTRETEWTSGMVDTRDKFMFSKSTWVIESKTCDSWLAIWLLKKDYKVPGYKTNKIIPEIDILEVIKHRVRHTIHYGYSDEVYRKYGIGTSLFKEDGKFHEYAVETLNNGYKFYIDGILTGKFISHDSEFVSDALDYLIINNAGAVTDIGISDESMTKNTEFIIKSVKVYQ